MSALARQALQRMSDRYAETAATAAIDWSITYYRHKPSGNCDSHVTKLDGGGWFENEKEEPPGWYLYQRCTVCGKGFKHGPATRDILR